MKIKRLAALVLAGALLATTALGGCGTEEIDKEATVMTINGEEVSLGFANFVARYEQAQRDQIYISYLGEDAWESDSDGNGTTMEESTKEEVLGMIQDWYLLEQNQEAYGVTVTDGEMAAIKETAIEFIEDNTTEAIDQMGATPEYVEQMLYYYVLSDKMQEAIEAKATVTVTDEDAAQRTFSYIMLSGKGATTEAGTYELYDEDTLAEKKAEAEKAAQRAKTDFDAVAKEYDFEDVTYSYSPGDKALDAAMLSAADSLKEGEVSDLLEVQNGFFVIRLDSEYDTDASSKNKNSLIAAEKLAYFESVLTEYMDAATIEVDEKQWAKVKFDTLFSIVTEE